VTQPWGKNKTVKNEIHLKRRAKAEEDKTKVKHELQMRKKIILGGKTKSSGKTPKEKKTFAALGRLGKSKVLERNRP